MRLPEEKSVMEIEKTVDGNAVMLSLTGWLDALSAPVLEEELARLDGSVTDLALDLEGLRYISSAGLRQIVLAHKKMAGKGSCVLIRVPEEIMETLRMTGLSERLHIIT